MHMLGFLDEAKAPAVGVRCRVGETPNDYRTILQSRFSLWCAQDDGSVSSPLVLFFSDSGVVVQRGAPSYRALYKHSDP